MSQIIGSLDRGLRILEMLGASDDPLGVAEIAETLKVDKSTAYRLLQTLQARHFVRQIETGQYRLGPKCIQLGSLALKSINIRIQARPFLEELAARTGQTVHLATLVGDRAIYVSRVQGASVITISTEVGMEAPGHCASSGKVLLAYLPPEQVRGMYQDRELPKYTPKTITDLDTLEVHLRVIRKQGYAVDDEERYLGVRCVGAPIFDHEGQVVASCSMSGPTSHVDIARLDELKETVIDVATRLSTQLGFTQ